MGTAIYYFSGTGNSLAAARDLASTLDDVTMYSMAGLVKKDCIPLTDEIVGFVVPVYCWGLPLIVVDSMKKIKPDKNAYFFGVATYGGSPGKTLLQLDALLKEKGCSLSSGFGICMPGNYTPLYGAPKREKQNALFVKEKEIIKTISLTVRGKKKSKIKTSNILANIVFSDLLYKTFISKMPAADRKFWVDEKCNGCKLCETVCPVSNVVMKDGKPHWHHACEQCLACLQWCPQEAVQFGKRTLNRKRYRHPDISYKDIAGQKRVTA